MSGIRRQVPTESWYPSAPRDRPSNIDPLELSDDEDDDRLNSTVDDSGAAMMRLAAHANSHMDSALDGNESTSYLWGDEVPYQRYRASSTRDENRHVERPKLMLVNTPHTRQDRERLRPRLAHLIESNIIRKYGGDMPDVQDVQDVITDFLIEVFNHTMQQLVQNEGFSKECPVSFVLTVPVIWSPRSSRVLQHSVQAAIDATGFGTLSHGSVDNLFIVPEPEAATTYLLGSSHDMLVSFSCKL